MTDRQVVARFTTTHAEMVEAIKALSGQLYGFKGVPWAQGLWMRLLLLLAGGTVTFLMLSIAEALGQHYGSFTSRDLAVAVFSALLAAWGLLIGLGRFQMRRVRAALAGYPAEVDVDIVADDDGLWWQAERERHFWRYGCFDRVLPFKGGYYLVSGLSGAFVPGRGFADEAARLRFEGLMRERLPPASLSLLFAAQAPLSG